MLELDSAQMPGTTAARARSHLEGGLLGYSISEVCLADWWVLRFSNGVFLVAQDFAAPEESEVRAVLTATSSRVLDAIDPEMIPKGVALYRRMRRRVVALDIGDDGTLRLQFEDAPELHATTNTSNVDWQ